MRNFANFCLDNGGIIKPLIIPAQSTNGTGLFNPTIYVDGDKILVNIRHCQYTLYHSELQNYEHHWGPLLYLNPENDVTLRTTNFFCNITEDLDIEKIFKVDTSEHDVEPIWTFIGLEDARIIKWHGKLYLSGVRRDTTTDGQGRMELSELMFGEDFVKEVSRHRIPAPNGDNSYCEKNWMPIIDQPFHYVKWSNPVEVVKYDMNEKTCETVALKDFDKTLGYALRGGSQVIPYKDGYLALHHVTDLFFSDAGRKNATYRHQFTHWDKDWNVIKRSRVFDFMDGHIEFSCGMAKHNNDYLITFGFQDNAAYIAKISDSALEEFINE